MEDLTLKKLLIRRMQDILSDVKWANSLVEEGKEVPADRKLQGIRTKVMDLLKLTHQQIPDDLDFIREEASVENVAQTTPEN